MVRRPPAPDAGAGTRPGGCSSVLGSWTLPGWACGTAGRGAKNLGHSAPQHARYPRWNPGAPRSPYHPAPTSSARSWAPSFGVRLGRVAPWSPPQQSLPQLRLQCGGGRGPDRMVVRCWSFQLTADKRPGCVGPSAQNAHIPITPDIVDRAIPYCVEERFHSGFPLEIWMRWNSPIYFFI